ncbi:hypothetical protein [Streptomyces sp. NPDC055681]
MSRDLLYGFKALLPRKRGSVRPVGRAAAPVFAPRPPDRRPHAETAKG